MHRFGVDILKMSVGNVPDPSDAEAIKTELRKIEPKPPCNMWGFFKEIMEDLEELKQRITALEVRKLNG